MAQYKTPGVYIVEKNAFPNSVVEVATAVPAFIGYTEKAARDKTDLINIPTRISSLAEFDRYFGGPPKALFTIDVEIFSATSEDWRSRPVSWHDKYR